MKNIQTLKKLDTLVNRHLGDGSGGIYQVQYADGSSKLVFEFSGEIVAETSGPVFLPKKPAFIARNPDIAAVIEILNAALNPHYRFLLYTSCEGGVFKILSPLAHGKFYLNSLKSNKMHPVSFEKAIQINQILPPPELKQWQFYYNKATGLLTIVIFLWGEKSEENVMTYSYKSDGTPCFQKEYPIDVFKDTHLFAPLENKLTNIDFEQIQASIIQQ